MGPVPDDLLRNRGLSRFDKICAPCGGWGVKWYSSGATWRGGVGTTSSEQDVCNVCWGSGNTDRPWPNLKTLEADTAKLVQERALTLLVDAAGAHSSVMQPAITELVLELQKFAKGRKPRPPFFVELCLSLIRTFKR